MAQPRWPIGQQLDLACSSDRLTDEPLEFRNQFVCVDQFCAGFARDLFLNRLKLIEAAKITESEQVARAMRQSPAQCVPERTMIGMSWMSPEPSFRANAASSPARDAKPILTPTDRIGKALAPFLLRGHPLIDSPSHLGGRDLLASPLVSALEGKRNGER